MTAYQTVKLVRHAALPVTTSAFAGFLVGVAAYHAAPWLAALSSGVGGFVTMLAVQMALGLRRAFGRMVTGV